MVTNTDATLYHRMRGKKEDTWQRVYLSEVWWYEVAKSDITTNGLKSVNTLTVRIPDTSVDVQKGDYIVKGNCDIEINTVKDLASISHYCVEGANYNLFGSNPHIKVVGA